MVHQKKSLGDMHILLLAKVSHQCINHYMLLKDDNLRRNREVKIVISLPKRQLIGVTGKMPDMIVCPAKAGMFSKS
jgi:hypothetical protein